MRAPLALCWFFLVLSFMVWAAKPLDLWQGKDFASAAAFFCVVNLGGVSLAAFIERLIPELALGFKDGFRQAMQERELSEAELE